MQVALRGADTAVGFTHAVAVVVVRLIGSVLAGIGPKMPRKYVSNSGGRRPRADYFIVCLGALFVGR
jgi:hypothetical protein